MILYKSSQVNIDNLTLPEVRDFFSSIKNSIIINIQYQADELEHLINKITKDKIKNMQINIYYIGKVLLDYIFKSNENLIKFGTESFRINLIKLIKKDKDLIEQIRFVTLHYGNLHYHLLTSYNIKFIEKTRHEYNIEYYKLQFNNNPNYERYTYENKKWQNNFASLYNQKIIISDILDYYRTALSYIEIIYHFMIINHVFAEQDLNRYLKLIYFISLKDTKNYNIIVKS